MLLPAIHRGKLLRRYKRFLADVELESGEVIVAHCPNPGSMIGCAEPGAEVWLRHSSDPKRKLPYTWIMTVVGDVHINVDTLLANRLVGEALAAGVVPELSAYTDLLAEQSWGDSRFDFRLVGGGSSGLPDCLVEVKSTTLAYDDCCMFPDAKTVRGLKHLDCLIKAKSAGLRAVQFYCVARNDVAYFAPAAHIDKAYADGLRRAAEAGVEILCWTIEVSPAGDGGAYAVQLARAIPVKLDAPVAIAGR